MPAGTFKSVSADRGFTCAVKTDDTLACWGHNPSGQASPPAGTFKSVSGGLQHTCAVKTDATLACWGDNFSGRASPPAGSFKSVSAAGFHNCGLKSDDTLACWGNNFYGQISAPAGVFKSVSVGVYVYGHSCAIKADDTLVCWGSNANGQSTPPAGSFKSLDAGGDHNCAVKTDDTLACWGNNSLGQSTPPAGTFKSVSAGSNHSCAVKSDDTLICWGANFSGQSNAPGNDTTAPVIAPTVSGTVGENGWYTTNAQLSWSVTDAESAITSQSGCDAVTVTADQQATDYTCTATSTGGTASETVSIKRDAHDPVVTVTGVSDGATYTQGSVPTAGCDTTDSTSGVATAATLSSTGGPVGTVTVTCSGARDNAGNTASASATYTVVADSTAPVIAPTVTGTVGDNGWYTTNAHLSWSVTDNQSEITNKTGCDALDVTADQQATSYTCTATSTGGTASETVSIKRDAHDPVVTVTGVNNGATYTPGSVPTAGCDTQDSTSGVATAATLSSTGGPLGTVTKTCSGARDNAGNTASASATYTVQYAFTGFFAPIDNGNVLNEMNAGRAVPVKFSLGGNQGLDIFATGSPSSQQIGCDSSVPVGAVEETTGAGSSSLSYDAGSDRYNYVWKTDSAWAGTCRQLTVTLRDGTSHTAKFKFR